MEGMQLTKRKGAKKSTNKEQTGTDFIVITKNPEDYTPFDIRANKPICFKENPLKGGNGSMVLQEVESIKFPTKINGKNNTLNYYAPNNVGMLLSISQKSLLEAKLIYKKELNPDAVNHLEDYENMNRKETIIRKSKIMYDFIETVQIAIVFGYTALEAFANLSIPSNYQYKSDINSKGIIEIYDKKAIERWVTLKLKVSDILVEVYKTKDIKKTKLWNQFLQFEQLRNEIIHQKAIEDTKFYHKYLQKDFFNICNVPEDIIKFFYDELEGRDTTNPLWPWIIDRAAGIPMSYDYKSENLEVIGNIYEGRQK